MIRRNVIDFSRPHNEDLVRGLVNTAIDKGKPNHILLVLLSGEYDEKHQPDDPKLLKGFTTGQRGELLSSRTQQRFLRWYFENSDFIHNDSDVLPKVDIDDPRFHAATVVESMIYLTFWESDTTLMLLYQLTRLSLGEDYDWHWRKKLESSKSRMGFFRLEIRNKLAESNKELYEFFKVNVVPQVRNAAAHSQIGLLTNCIKLVNYSDNPNMYSPLLKLEHQVWESLICNTISFRGALVGVLNEIGKSAKGQFPSGKFPVNLELDSGEQKRGWFKI